MQISGVSLTLTWPLRLCLLRVLLGTTATATSFPLSKHTGGGDTAPAFSGRHVYLQLRWEVGLPRSPVQFSSHCRFYKLSCSWLLGMCRHSCLLQPACLFTVLWGISSTPSSELRAPRPLWYVSFLLFLLIIQIFFCFFPRWGVVFPGGNADLAQGCLWEYCILLRSPCGLHLPRRSGCWHLAVRETSWFLHLTWSGDAMRRVGVWRSHSFASSHWFFL
jgi:hypothetical protein